LGKKDSKELLKKNEDDSGGGTSWEPFNATGKVCKEYKIGGRESGVAMGDGVS